MRFSTALVAVAAPLAAVVSAIDTIVVSNRHLAYNSTGKPFWIKGVDYQPGGASAFASGSDPLSDADTCARDVYMFQQLGVNTVRVYSVDPSVNHDECMTMLAAAGIYLILDVNSPLQGQNLNNQEPWTTYTPEYLQHIFSVIEVFAGYDNTLAFLAGNEVIFDTGSAKASPNYVKAVIRDMKAYLTNHVARTIPVGYSNADDLRYRTSLAAYLQCGNVGYTDFFGVNSYQWCGDQTFQSAGYDQLVDAYQNYSLPVFFTEYGCNKSPPRRFEETTAMFSDQMTGVFSGGLAYEYTNETNNFGLVTVDSKGDVESIPDFKTLQGVFAKVDASTLTIPSSAKNNTRPTTCPPSDDPVYDNITANLTLPTTLGQDMIDNGLPKGTNITRGKFVTNASMKTTKKVTLEGSTVSDPQIKSTESTNDAPLPSGGTGINTGGGVGTGGSTTDSAAGGSSGNNTKAGSAMVASQPVFAIVSSLVSVAFVFGVFL